MNKAELELIQSKIFVIRGHKVMIDSDLAELYGVDTKRLNEQVKRNIKRFPKDFMFQLTEEEATLSRSQIATLKKGRGSNIKYLPYAFTQNGIAMLSSVLNSEQAISVNISIMRVFVKTSELLRNQAELYQRIDKFARQGQRNSEDIEKIFRVIYELYDKKKEDSKKKIGFD